MPEHENTRTLAHETFLKVEKLSVECDVGFGREGKSGFDQVFHFKLVRSRADKVYSYVVHALLPKVVYLILSATSYLMVKVCELLS